MGVDRSLVAGANARIQHSYPVVLEQQRVMVRRSDQSIEVAGPGRVDRLRSLVAPYD